MVSIYEVSQKIRKIWYMGHISNTVVLQSNSKLPPVAPSGGRRLAAGRRPSIPRQKLGGFII